jgi:hypothetical protein
MTYLDVTLVIRKKPGNISEEKVWSPEAHKQTKQDANLVSTYFNIDSTNQLDPFPECGPRPASGNKVTHGLRKHLH